MTTGPRDLRFSQTRCFSLVCATALWLSGATAGEPAQTPAGNESSPTAAPATLVSGGLSGNYIGPKVTGRGRADYITPGPGSPDSMIRFRACISAEGSLTSLEIEPGGFYRREFVPAAERYIRSLRFAPATLDGEPVPGCITLPFQYTVNTDSNRDLLKSVSRAFRRELDKVVEMIRAGDSAGAHHHAQWMLGEKVNLFYEYAVLHATLADTYARTNQPHRAMESAREATGRRGTSFPRMAPGDPLPENRPEHYLLDQPLIVQLLKLRMMLAASNGLTVDALQSYYQLLSLSKADADENILREGRRLETALTSGGQLSGRIVLGEAGDWWHPLTRSSFTIAGVQGKVEKLHLRCDANLRELAYADDVDWQVPATWRECWVRLEGKPGTEFHVVEFAEGGDLQTETR